MWLRDATRCPSVGFRFGHFEAEARLIGSNEASDLVFFMIESDVALPRAAFGGDLPVMPGEMTGMLGFPGGAGSGPTFTQGTISSLAGFSGSLLDFQYNAETRSRSSGSPVVDQSGNVVGVVTGILSRDGGRDDAINGNYGTRGLIVQVFLELNGVECRLARSDSPRPLTEAVKEMQRYIGVVNGCRGEVTYLSPALQRPVPALIQTNLAKHAVSAGFPFPKIQDRLRVAWFRRRAFCME